MSEKELEFTTRLTREDVAGVIEALVEGLKNGRLKIHKSDEVLEMDVPRVIDLEVEAKVSHERAKFEIEVSWRTNRAENPDRPEEDGVNAAFCEKAVPEEGEHRTDKDSAPKKAKSTVKKTPAASAAKKSAKPAVKPAARKKGKAGGGTADSIP